MNSVAPAAGPVRNWKPKLLPPKEEVAGFKARRLPGREAGVERVLNDVVDDATEIRPGQWGNVAEHIASQ